MEVIEYEHPESWEDKGMNWNTPDPANADYVMAIRQAIMERCAALHTSVDSRVLKISPWKTISRTAVAGIVDTISRLARNFVNLDWEEFEDDWSDFPKMWTYGDLIQERNCRLYEWAAYGSLRENGGSWLKQIRNAIDRLTVIRANDVHGKTYSRYGTKHDPPFDESIGTAMQQAMENGTESVLHGSFPSSVYAWSGNTHWCCPRPDYEGDPEYNKDGYCGYAQSQAYLVTAARNWLAGAQFDIFAAVLTERPTGPVPYSQQLDTSIFDSGSSGYREGFNWTERVRVKSDKAFELPLGDPDTIPKNGTVPSSEFDGDGNAIKRHSAKLGWTGKVWGFLDYGVEGGFKFRSKES